VANSKITDLRYRVADRRAARRARRERLRDKRAPKRAARRVAMRKVAVCLLMVAALAFLAVMVGTSDYTASAIGWIPLIMLVAAIVLSYFYLQILKRSLDFEETSDLRDCARGEQVTFSVRLANRAPLFAFRTEVAFFISDLFGNVANELTTSFSLSPRESTDISFAARFEHIGTHQAGLEKIVVTDFLNLFTATIENPMRHTVQVTPKLQTLDTVAFSNDANVESTTAAKSVIADSMDYAYVREYVPGDPLKTIHWKLSARSQTYMTRLFEIYTNPGVSLVMDFYADDDDPGELMSMFDAIIECTLSIGEYARQQGMNTEIHYMSRHHEHVTLTSWDVEDLATVIEDVPSMSSDKADKQTALDLIDDQTTAQHGQNNLVVVSADLDADLISAVLDAKNKRRNPMMIAVIPTGLVGKDRDKYCAPLARLDAADVPYIALSSSDELSGAVV
jgi:uncharacterized protein (DUF58 family)